MEQQKKFLLVIIFVGVFLVIVILAGLYFFAPRGTAESALAAAFGKAAGADSALSLSPSGTAPSSAAADGAASANGAPLSGADARTAAGAYSDDAMALDASGQASANALAGASSATGESGKAESTTVPSVNASEWLRNPSAIQGLTPQSANTTSRGDVIIFYGERSPEAAKSAAAIVDSVSESGMVINVAPPAVQTTPVVPTAATTSAAPAATAPAQSSGQTASANVASAQPTATQTAVSAAPATTAPVAAVQAKPSPAKPAASVQTAAATKATAPTKAPAPVLIDEYWVQTGAFAVRSRAEDVKSSLADKGITALIETRDVDGKTYFRVRVGPYASKSEADYWLSLIKGIDGFSESYVSLIKVKR